MDRLEVLTATMHQDIKDLSISKKMNIKSDNIIINQTDTIGYAEEIENNYKIKMFSFNERGVGKSRNNALLRSSSDICLMADDDMVYVDNYQDIVKNAYYKYPDADFIVFNVRVHYSDRIEERVKKSGKVHFHNSLKYGTVTFSFKRKAILKNNIFFSLLFGGGAQYGSGEDTLFIWTALKKGLKVYADQSIIADVYNLESSWFKGYNDKFYKDKGALFQALSPRLSKILNIQLAIRKKNEYSTEKSVLEVIRLMNKGSREYKNLK